MVIKIKVKNADKYVLLDHEVFEALSGLILFQEYDVLDHIREHSSGVPVFQKYLNSTVDGKLKVETIYLAHFIAKKYIPHPESEKRMFLNFINGDKLDLRLKNLKWESMNQVKRSPRKTSHDKNGFGDAHEKENHKIIKRRRAKKVTPLEIDEVSLLPTHFDSLKKKRVQKEKLNGKQHTSEDLPADQGGNITEPEPQPVEQLIPHENHLM